MYYFFYVFLLLLPLSLSVTPLSVLVLTDIHLNPQYDGNFDYTTNCMANPIFYDFSTQNAQLKIESSANGYSSYSKYGCDPSERLISIVLDEAKKRNGNPDIVLVAGDFIGHGFSQDLDQKFNNQTFTELIQIHQKTMSLIRERFGNSLIIPSVGNNDNEFHYEVPLENEKGKWYDFLYGLWFEESQSLAIQQNLASIKETFINGGYYKVDVNEQLSVIALNTLYYSKKNDEDNDPVAANLQFEWLQNVLEEIKNNQPLKKILITFHIQPGYKYEGSGTREWNDTYVQTFNDILLKYDNQIIGTVCSHTHLSSIRSFKAKSSMQLIKKSLKNKNFFFSTENAKNYGASLISPSITTIDYSNPGVSFINIDIKTQRYVFKNLKYLFLNLDKLNKNPDSEQITDFSPFFYDIDLNAQFGLTDLSAKSIDDFTQNLTNDDDLFKNYLATTVGYPLEEPYFTNSMKIFADFGLIKDISSLKVDSSERQQYICIMTNMVQQDYLDCKAAAS
jgi:Calcineurin-like phosphoesterase